MAKPTLRPRTFESYGAIVEGRLLPALGSIRLSQLSAAEVDRFVHSLIAGGLSPQTAKNHFAVLRRALTIAERWDYIEKNPTKGERGAQAPKVERAETTVLTAAQVRHLFEVTRDTREHALWVIALTTGARLAELIGLRWESVDLGGARLRVRGTSQHRGGQRHRLPPKTPHSNRTVGLQPEAVDALRAQRRQQSADRLAAGRLRVGDELGGLVFTTEQGAPIAPWMATRRLRGAFKAASLPLIRFHDARHSCATFLLQSGGSLKMAADWLGHSTTAVTSGICMHVLEESRQDATDRLGQHLGLTDAGGVPARRKWTPRGRVPGNLRAGGARRRI